jgi:hypothetical protein
LTPEVEGGSSELSNAAPLCASCHDLYGGNPEKYEIMPMGVHWPEIDEDLSIAGMLGGRRASAPAA